MKLQDALNVLSINQDSVTFDMVKKAYRVASKSYHPDINPAGHAMMQAVNEAYETLQEQAYPLSLQNGEKLYNYGKELNDALNSIIHIYSLYIEVCGSWVWVSGATKQFRDELKVANFKYSPKKQMWYFRPESQTKRFYRGNASIDEIRAKYGSQKVKTRTSFVLGAG